MKNFNFKGAMQGLSGVMDKVNSFKQVVNEKVDDTKEGIANVQLPQINYGMTVREKWQLAGLGAGLILLVYFLFGKKKPNRITRRTKKRPMRRMKMRRMRTNRYKRRK
jgi:hypothetical protein